MSDLKDILLESEGYFGVPGISGCYDGMDKDMKKYFDDIWPILVKYTKMSLASGICVDLLFHHKYPQYIYLALKVKFMLYFLNYPGEANLNFVTMINSSTLDYNTSLKLIDSGAEIFLYLNTFALEGCSGKNIKVPFVLGIKYNEELKDVSINITNYKGITICEMSQDGVDNELKNGFKIIDDLIGKHLASINEGIIRKEPPKDIGGFDENGDMLF